MGGPGGDAVVAERPPSSTSRRVSACFAGGVHRARDAADAAVADRSVIALRLFWRDRLVDVVAAGELSLRDVAYVVSARRRRGVYAAPQFQQSLDANDARHPGTVIGNPNLVAQRVLSYDLGVEHAFTR